MGEAVLEQFADVAEIRLSMPNKHHFLQALSAFGLDNPDVVYHADDRPYGLIEGAVVRDDVPSAPVAWQGTPGFCCAGTTEGPSPRRRALVDVDGQSRRSVSTVSAGRTPPTAAVRATSAPGQPRPSAPR
jgi:hypothetical protein